MGFLDSPWDIVIVLVVFMLLFGSAKLPDAAKNLGQAMRVFKKEVQTSHDDKATPPPAVQGAVQQQLATPVPAAPQAAPAQQPAYAPPAPQPVQPSPLVAPPVQGPATGTSAPAPPTDQPG